MGRLIHEDTLRIWKADCNVTGDIADKYATISYNTEIPSGETADSLILTKGSIVFVTFKYTNTASVTNLTLTLAVDRDETTPKPIKVFGNTTVTGNLPATGMLMADQTYQFQYNGTNWVLMDVDTAVDGYYFQRYNNGPIAVKKSTPAYVLCLFDKSTNLIPINTSGSTSGSKAASTFSTDEFCPFSEIMYPTSGQTTVNGTIPGWALCTKRNAIDLRYSFNLASTSVLTANKPVYLRCTLQSSGNFKLDTANVSSTPSAQTLYRQNLPTTADSRYYIYLGQAIDGYRVELHEFHPIYYYSGGIKNYTGASTSSSVTLSGGGGSSTTYYLMGTLSTIGSTLYRYGTNGPYMYGSDLFAGSDLTYKKDVTPISNEFVSELFSRDDITYDFKWKDTEKNSSGFIAQWIEDIMPEVVNGKDGEKHVNYNAALSKVVGALFKVVKEQQNEINELKHKIELIEKN